MTLVATAGLDYFEQGEPVRVATLEVTASLDYFEQGEPLAVAGGVPGLTISPASIASTEAFGTATLTLVLQIISPSAIASTETFGASQVDGDPSPDVTRFEYFLQGEPFPHILKAGSGDLDYFDRGDAVVAFVLGLEGASVVQPAGIATTEAFGTASLTTGAVTISPSGIATAEAFGGAVITTGALIQPSAIASTEAFGTAALTVGAGTQTLSPAGIATTEAFGTLALFRRVGFVHDLLVSGWETDAGATTGLFARTGESVVNDATYIVATSAPATEVVYRGRFGPLPRPQTSQGYRILMRRNKDSGTDRIALIFRLYAADGTTLITEARVADIGTVLEDGVVALSVGNVDAVPNEDWQRGLIGELAAVVGSGGSGGSFEPWF